MQQTVSHPKSSATHRCQRQPQPRGRRKGQRRADKREQQWLRCSALQQRINHVNSAMRVGYRGRRGEKLRAQWQQLKSTYYDQRCLGVH